MRANNKALARRLGRRGKTGDFGLETRDSSGHRASVNPFGECAGSADAGQLAG